MKTTLSTLLLSLLPIGAALADDHDDDAHWRASVRGGVTWQTEPSFEPLAEGAVSGGPDLDFARAVTGNLWLAASLATRTLEDETFVDYRSEYSGVGLRLLAEYRLALGDLVALRGRFGPSAWWYDVAFEGETTLRAEGFSPGLYGGLAVDVLLLRSDIWGEAGPFALGLCVEAGYERVFDVELADAGTRLGSLNPSGPSLTGGFVVQF